MSSPDRSELLRAPLFHTPGNPFREERALESYGDGGLLIRSGRIAVCGDYSRIQSRYPEVPTTDLRGGFLLPGLIDTHLHFPQVRVLGSLGHSLLDWLEDCALPEEARMAGEAYSRSIACDFIRALASHGTTTALAFGAHFAPATAALFEAAEVSGLRLISGLVVSDRGLLPELHQTPEAAYHANTELIRRFHRRGRLRYALTPRFALSTSEAMLEVCQTLFAEHDDLRVQTHLNENPSEIAAVTRLFPWARDYLAVCERFGLVGSRAVMAHNVHPTNSELERLAATNTAIAHCPCSNAALGSGVFPFRRHVQAGVHCALGTDVGAGAGFSLFKEALQAYLMQRTVPEGWVLNPAQMLYLATRAGAEALGLESEIGDFQEGKAADLVYLRPGADSPLASVVKRAEFPEQVLAALFTLAGADVVKEVRVDGRVVYRATPHLAE